MADIVAYVQGVINLVTREKTTVPQIPRKDEIAITHWELAARGILHVDLVQLRRAFPTWEMRLEPQYGTLVLKRPAYR